VKSITISRSLLGSFGSLVLRPAIRMTILKRKKLSLFKVLAHQRLHNVSDWHRGGTEMFSRSALRKLVGS